MKFFNTLQKWWYMWKIRCFARKYPKTALFVKENDTMNIRCKRCGCVVLKDPNIEEYPFQCMNCDENMYGVEVYLGDPRTEKELLQLMNDTLLLELDEII